MKLNDLPTDARPREKLIALGPAALSDSELLAVLLRTGLPGKSVLALAQELIQRFGGLAGLLHAPDDALRVVKGLGGPAKRSQLTATLEMARRAAAEPLRSRDALGSAEAVKHYVQLHLGRRPHEVFAVLFMDTQHRLIAMEELFRGTLDQTSVHPREVVLGALRHEAHSVVLAHNHPSGTLQPSRADEALTRHLVQALRLVDVQVLDHVIVAPGGALSMAEHGLL